LVKLYWVWVVQGCREEEGLSGQRCLNDQDEPLDIRGILTILEERLYREAQVSGRRWAVVQIQIEPSDVRVIAWIGLSRRILMELG
jgi:hypothetical protein